MLAVYEHESERTGERLATRVEAAPDPAAAVEVWIDETLALATRAGRARRTAPLAAEGPRLQARFPDEFAAIVERQLAPLRRAIAAGREDGTFADADPDADAWAIHAVTWAAVQRILAGTLSPRTRSPTSAASASPRCGGPPDGPAPARLDVLRRRCETMDRAGLEAMQEELLRELLPAPTSTPR